MLDMEVGLPRLIQAGMGAHISCARLANTTSRLGALGVVSSVGLRKIVIEQVRMGDAAALHFAQMFPLQQYVDEIMAFAPGGEKNRRMAPMDTPDPEKCELPRRLSAICAYVEVMRAKHGHRGMVGINVMWKLALSALPTIYGAMLAGVDALLCGAGVPMELPDIIRRIRAGEDLAYHPLTGTGTNATLDISQDRTSSLLESFKAPCTLPILSNFAFCKRMLDNWMQKYNGAQPDGFILENHTAGGHNAPPRNKVEFSDQDDINVYFDKVRALGRPIFVAGAFPDGGTRPDFLAWRERGAHGIQVGSRFALCEESGLRADLKEEIIRRNAAGESEVVTDNRISPTGYPFKFIRLPNSLSDPAVHHARKRLCNLGFLLHSHFETLPDGTVRETYICPAMPPKQYVKLGGTPEDNDDRVCLCNALLSTAGYAPEGEAPLVTLGVSGTQVKELVSARRVIEDILTPEYVAARERQLSC